MNGGTRLAVAVLGSALALGVAGDVLFHGQALGLNVGLWAVAFVAALTALIRLGRVPLHQGRRLMVAPVLVFAACFAWHDSPLLTAVNLVALAAAVTLGALRRGGPRIHLAGLAEYAGGLVAGGCAAIGGALPLLAVDIRWSELRSGVRPSRMAAVGRGVAIGAPLVLLFGGLFVAADAVFKGLVTGVLPRVSTVPTHVALILVWSWLAAGLLRDILAVREERRFVQAAAVTSRRSSLALGPIELTVVLGALDLLFLAFVLVQFRYLFGGKGLVEARTHLTYAQYARQGFFELVAVAALVLPLLLLADWAFRRERANQDRLFRALAGLLLALLGVVMASALQRMRLYQSQYGLTELRVYATGLILWLAVVFVWFGATVLHGHRRLFAVGALVSGFAASAALNVLNPDALIARTNLSRPQVDVAYLASLSDDAVPTLVGRLPALEPGLRRQLAAALLARERPAHDWRSWNLSRRRAERALGQVERAGPGPAERPVGARPARP
jgi:hypothetical protein